MKFTIDKIAKDIAEKVFDEIPYEENTIGNWVEILAKLQPIEDCLRIINKYRKVRNDD